VDTIAFEQQVEVGVGRATGSCQGCCAVGRSAASLGAKGMVDLDASKGLWLWAAPGFQLRING
jgi:hypothetical protein